MKLDDLKCNVDLIAFAREAYQIKVNDDGKGSCPFHPPDNNNSFSIFKSNDGAWRWKDFHDGEGGTIVDLVCRMENINADEAIKGLFEKYGEPRKAKKRELGCEREHVYLDADGQPVFKKLKYRPSEKGPSWGIFHYEAGEWKSGKGDRALIPYRLDEFKDKKRVIIAEGEKDADMINALDAGVFATSAPTGKGNWPDAITPHFKQFEQILFLYDVGNDQDVKKHAAKLHAAFPKTEIFIARIPSDIPEFDITDYLKGKEKKEVALHEVLNKAELLYPESSSFVSLSEIAPVEVPWLWRNFIPLDRASIISGDPGSGKTFFALDLAARVSRGLPWPDGAEAGKPGNVIYMSLEDNPSDTLRPRVDSLGGDPGRISVLNLDRTELLDLSSEKGIKVLEQEIGRITDIRLVVIDPALDFTGRTRPNAPEEVRAFLNPLIGLAARFNFALLIIGHLNKSQTMDALYRTSGATSAWLGKCRAAFLIFRDREDPSRRYLSALKSNLAPQDPAQLSFRLINGQVIFERLEERIDIDDHINPQRKQEAEGLSFAIQWLKDALREEPAEFKELRKAAVEAGIPQATLYRAGRKINVISRASGFGKFKTSTWELKK